MLTKSAIRALYDQAGVRQERASFYHDATAAEMLARVPLTDTAAVLEFGCGTGRFAERLLEEHLPPEARYLGLDISSVMVDLTRDRLAYQRSRVEVVQTDGSIRLPAADQTQEVVFSNYVLDLLTEEDIELFLSEAARVLRPGGLLGLTGLGSGDRLGPRAVAQGWRLVH